MIILLMILLPFYLWFYCHSADESTKCSYLCCSYWACSYHTIPPYLGWRLCYFCWLLQSKLTRLSKSQNKSCWWEIHVDEIILICMLATGDDTTPVLPPSFLPVPLHSLRYFLLPPFTIIPSQDQACKHTTYKSCWQLPLLLIRGMLLPFLEEWHRNYRSPTRLIQAVKH